MDGWMVGLMVGSYRIPVVESLDTYVSAIGQDSW